MSHVYCYTHTRSYQTFSSMWSLRKGSKGRQVQLPKGNLQTLWSVRLYIHSKNQDPKAQSWEPLQAMTAKLIPELVIL